MKPIPMIFRIISIEYRIRNTFSEVWKKGVVLIGSSTIMTAQLAKMMVMEMDSNRVEEMMVLATM